MILNGFKWATLFQISSKDLLIISGYLTFSASFIVSLSSIYKFLCSKKDLHYILHTLSLFYITYDIVPEIYIADVS